MMNKFLLFIIVLFACFATTLSAENINESFDNYVDASYGTVSTFTDANGGMWETNNSLAEGSANSRTGAKAVRFNDDSGANEYLIYNGIDGNGKDGGLATVSFWYRHWDADGSNVSFQAEYNQAGGGWMPIGAQTSVTSTTYAEFTATVNLSGDDILFRIRAVEDAERLIIDDVVLTDVVLPVELGEMKAAIKASNVDLTWNTYQEVNNDYFEIQHSTDNRSFETIELISGAGDSEELINYSFTHRSPANGVNYYRLQQFDFDGQSSYSPVVSVRFESANEISVFPNPVKEAVTLALENEFVDGAVAEIISQNGKVVSREELNAQAFSQTLNTNRLSSGVYILRVVNGKDVYTQRFVKK